MIVVTTNFNFVFFSVSYNILFLFILFCFVFFPFCVTMIFTGDGREDDDNEVENTDNSNSLPFGRSIAINSLISRSNKEFPNDVGIFAAFLFNCFRLKKNILKANLQHAYLSDDCFECMACSDNVARAELTPKLRATNVLCQIVDYVAQESPVFNPQVISQNKRLVSYYLCYFSFGVVSDIIGEAFFCYFNTFSGNIIETIRILKWCNQCIYILDEEMSMVTQE